MNLFLLLLLLGVVVHRRVESASSGLTLMEKDMLCICRNFRDPAFPKIEIEGKPKDEYCESISFSKRWVPMFPRVELGVGIGGLRAQVFKSTSDPNNVAFAFRDFLHDKTHYSLDDDYWQTFSWENPFMLYLRHFLGFDYYHHSSAFVDQVLARGDGKRRPVFTGYGQGGVIAMLQTLRLETSFAITFSTPLVFLQSKAMVEFYHYAPTSKRITNLVLKETIGVTTDSPVIECSFPFPDAYSLVFGEGGNHTVAAAQAVQSSLGFVLLEGPTSPQRTCHYPL